MAKFALPKMEAIVIGLLITFAGIWIVNRVPQIGRFVK